MSNTVIITSALCLCLAACVPQVELVNIQSEMAALREDTKATKARVQEMQKRFNQDVKKRMDTPDSAAKGSGDVQNVQRAVADYGARTDQLATDIQLLQGKLEENNFRIEEFIQKLDDKNVKIAELADRIDALETRMRSAGPAAGTGSPEQTGGGVDKEKKSAAPKAVEPSDAYRQAKTDFDKGNYDLALAGFQNFLDQYPETGLASSAQYWIGECYYAKKDHGKAVEAFGKVIKNYPKSEKIPGAKLKIGLVYLSENNTAKAREYLNKVIKEHPNAAESAIAKDRLHKIGK